MKVFVFLLHVALTPAVVIEGAINGAVMQPIHLWQHYHAVAREAKALEEYTENLKQKREAQAESK